MKPLQLHGLIVSVVTPFGDDLSVDYDGVRRHVGWLVGQGVHSSFATPLWIFAPKSRVRAGCPNVSPAGTLLFVTKDAVIAQSIRRVYIRRVGDLRGGWRRAPSGRLPGVGDARGAGSCVGSDRSNERVAHAARGAGSHRLPA
jgi:hypothetical protein